jgi:hypothetical protein
LLKVFLSKLTPFSQGNDVLHVPAQTQMVFSGQMHGFLLHFKQDYLDTNEPFSTLKTMIFRKYSLENLPHFSQGDNVLDSAASTIDSFLWRDTYVSPTQLNMSIRSKQSLSPP